MGFGDMNLKNDNEKWIPRRAIVIYPYQKFFKKLVSGSYPLLSTAILALVWANLSAASYHSIWHTQLSLSLGDFQITKSLIHWIDEALMTLFFFTVGLEIKRENLVGELASFKKALLPMAAAIGGMVVPAGIYVAFNYNTPSMNGWGIPMATDIAFSLAVLAILGKKVPFGVKVFLSAFAIADDLGAVLVIALFYTQIIVWGYLIIALFLVAALALANYLSVRWALVYGLLGIGMWIAFLGSGVHATVAGVIVAMFIPAIGKYDTATFITNVKASIDGIECRDGCGYSILLNKDHQNAVHNIELACHEVETPLQRLEYGLHPWVAFMVLPLFALANSGIVLHDLHLTQAFSHPVTLGVALGLMVGKPLGISLFTFLAVKVLKTQLLAGIYWHHIIGASVLGGIGFTMSLFITGLSFSVPEFSEFSKLGIITASILSGITGIIILNRTPIKKD